MAGSLKPYLYTHGTNAALDAQFAGAPLYCRIRPGTTHLFWKPALRWYAVPLDRVQRIFRRVEDVSGKVCCGRQNFRTERLVLILKDGKELDLYIGDDVEPKAKALLQTLKDSHPEILYGKP